MAIDEVECPFCAIVNGQDPTAYEVWRDFATVAFFPDHPALFGHTLVVPSEHAATIQELSKPSLDLLWRRAVMLAPAITQAVGADGFNLIQSNGAVAEQTVLHVHVHILPRSSSDRVGEIWPDLPALPSSLVEGAWKKVRDAVDSFKRDFDEHHVNNKQPGDEEDAIESRDRPRPDNL